MASQHLLISEKLLAECRSKTADIEVVRGYLEQKDCDVNIRENDEVCNMVVSLLVCNGSCTVVQMDSIDVGS